MNERERLVELLNEWESKENDSSPAESIADYLLENGVVVLPCKVGDYVSALDLSYYDTECKKPHYLLRHIKFRYGLLDEYKLGETLFLTDKEAMDFVQENNGTISSVIHEYLPNGSFMCGEVH